MNDQLPFGRAGENRRSNFEPVAPQASSRPPLRSESEVIKGGGGIEPPQKKRAKLARSQTVIFFNFLFSLFVFCLVILAAIFYYGKAQFERAGPSETAMSFEVRSGASITQIANSLIRRKLITDPQIFNWGVRAYGKQDAIKAGEYEVKAGASMKQIMETLVEGKAILHALTIVEGNTVFQAMQKIAADEILTGDMPSELPPEGSLIADTQRFGRGTTRQDMIERMRAQQTKLVEQIWAKRAPNLPFETIEQFLALASIVEKETGVAEERPRVAAVFVNRLRRGIRLQSDPTILYGIFGGEGRPADRPIYKSDLEKPTPYNTYTIDGIPPGPIAIPGRASLEAVANPAQTEDLFFVADGTGGHVFAKTLKEHNANVAKWRKIEKERKAAEDAPKTGN